MKAHPKNTKPARPAAPRQRRANLLFAGLTTLILVAGGAGAAGATITITTPSGQVDSFAAMPVYNVIGQRTDRVEFWPRARYHELARASGYPLPYTPQQALDESNCWGALYNMIGSCLDLRDLTALEQTANSSMACYSYQTDNVNCRFYDNVPVQITYNSENGLNSYQGLLNTSLGKGLDNDQLCLTALITPASSMPPATEEQYQQAYQTILEHLMQLTGDRPEETYPADTNVPYYSDGPIVWLLTFMQDRTAYPFPINDVGEATAVDSSSAWLTITQFSNLLLDDSWKGQSVYLPPWEQIGMAEPDRNDPEAVERFLQEYFQQMYSIDLQILRQENCYLILFQQYDSVVGLYYDPLLQTYTGFGIQ